MLVFSLFLAFLSASCALNCQTQSQSQHKEEEIIINHFFQNKPTKGVYVEIGALDGFLYSNTLQLHNCLNWSGILIEGSKNNFNNLTVNVQKFRSSNHVDIFHGAVCAPPTTEVTFLSGINPAVNGDSKEIASTFKERWIPGNAVATKVPCFPMSHYLEKYTHIDFFSLDVEGAELTALETINFNTVSIDMFLIELDGNNLEKNYKIRQFLFNLGFEECLNLIDASGLFIHQNPSTKGYKCPGKSTNIAFPNVASLEEYDFMKNADWVSHKQPRHAHAQHDHTITQ